MSEPMIDEIETRHKTGYVGVHGDILVRMADDRTWLIQRVHALEGELAKQRERVKMLREGVIKISNLSYTDVRGAVERYEFVEEENTYREHGTDRDWETARMVLAIPQEIAIKLLDETKG